MDLFSWYRLQRSTVLHIDAPHPLPATAAIISVVDCCHSSAGLPRSEYRNVLRVAYLKYSVLSLYNQKQQQQNTFLFCGWIKFFSTRSVSIYQMVIVDHVFSGQGIVSRCSLQFNWNKWVSVWLFRSVSCKFRAHREGRWAITDNQTVVRWWCAVQKTHRAVYKESFY